MRSTLTLICLLALSIAASAERAALITWWRNPEPDISHYVVYYGWNTNYYQHINAGNLTNRVAIFGLKAGRTYRFAVKAVNTSGLESELSETVSHYIPHSAFIAKVVFSATNSVTNIIQRTPLESNSKMFFNLEVNPLVATLEQSSDLINWAPVWFENISGDVSYQLLIE